MVLFTFINKTDNIWKKFNFTKVVLFPVLSWRNITLCALCGFLCLKGLYCAIRSSIICSGADYLCCITLNTSTLCVTGQFLQIIKSGWDCILILKEWHKSLAAVFTLQCIEQCWRKLVEMMNSQVSVSFELYLGSLNSRQMLNLSDFPGDSNLCSL